MASGLLLETKEKNSFFDKVVITNIAFIKRSNEKC